MALVLVPRVARASQPELEAPGIDGCPSASDLKSAITSHLGRDDFAATDAPRVGVRVRRQGEALVADVTVAMPKSSPTSRAIDGGTGGCADLIRAAALSIALAIEAEAPRAPAPVAPLPAPAPAPPAPLAAPPAPAPSPSPAPSSSPEGAPAAAENPAGARDLRADRAVVVVSAMSTVGLLPRASTGGNAAARVRITEGVWLSARGFFLPEARMPNDAFGMTLVAGGAGACVEPFGSKAIAAVGCAHAVLGSLAVVDAGVPMRNGGAKPFGAALVSAGVRARVAGPLTVEGAVEAAVPFAHPTFLTETCPSTGFQQPFAALALVLGVGVSIP